ncbi:MAG: right-handed parallel beta-helix repeat-containing protein, partial [Bacteroidales bacterium]|nr:right-handed parallel beta-helix repeat-containing protein [Bacteroidales bacterium]
MADSLHQNTIHLLEGTYGPSGNGEQFPIYMLDHVSMAGVSEDLVILDAEGLSQVIIVENNAASYISEMTMTGGGEESGHAIQCSSSLLEIQNLIIKDNFGGGISNSGDGLSLTDVSIVNNSVNGDGAGMSMYCASTLLKNVIISNNVASGDGGGIECNGSSPFLENVTISYNTAGGWGGGISGHTNNILFDSVHRCNIYMNNASWGTDIHYHFSDSLLNVIVDTFTVMNPTAYHINPRDWCNFDILNSKIQQADADLYVSPDGNDENSGLTTDDPLKTIRHAMLKIRADNLHRNTIRLMEGTYGPSSTGLDFPMIIPDYYRISGSRASEVFIDAEYQSDVVIIDSDKDVFVSDLTITGGSEGGIQIWGNPTFENLIIASNNGSGIRHLRITGHANANLINVLIANNTSTGLICSKSQMNLTNVTIADNGGDGIFCKNGGSIDMRNSIISNNAGYAVGFLGYNPTSFIYSYYSNIDGYVDPGGNGSVYYLSGTIEENPIFVGSGNYPFALSQESPCVDAGDPDTAGMFLPLWDLAGNQRIWDGDGNDTATIDMGAYEFGSMPVGISESRNQISEIRIECFPNPTQGKSDIRYQIS